jgi:hypothetical protein
MSLVNESHHRHRSKFSYEGKNRKKLWNTRVWGSGRDKTYLTIYLPNEFAEKYGIGTGSEIKIEDLDGKGLLIRT